MELMIIDNQFLQRFDNQYIITVQMREYMCILSRVLVITTTIEHRIAQLITVSMVYYIAYIHILSMFPKGR
jgi:hypothetical protein